MQISQSSPYQNFTFALKCKDVKRENTPSSANESIKYILRNIDFEAFKLGISFYQMIFLNSVMTSSIYFCNS
jgi:hypothetical protein